MHLVANTNERSTIAGSYLLVVARVEKSSTPWGSNLEKPGAAGSRIPNHVLCMVA